MLIAVIAVITASTAAYMPNLSEDSEVQEHITIAKMRSYTSIGINELKNSAVIIVKGTIIDKYTISENKDGEGILVNANSPDAVVKSLYLVYEIQPSKTFKGDKKDTIKVKVNGGSIGNLTVVSDTPDYKIGQEVIVILDGPFDNNLYQLNAGPHSIFVIENGKAIGKDNEFTTSVLENKLK